MSIKSNLTKAERGASSLADLGVDDIKLEYGSCPSFGSCTFENNDYCDWTNVYDKRDQFDWEFGSYLTGTSLTGPS
jgi:hypothetical protein